MYDSYWQATYEVPEERSEVFELEILNANTLGFAVEDERDLKEYDKTKPTWELTDFEYENTGLVTYKVYFEDSKEGMLSLFQNDLACRKLGELKGVVRLLNNWDEEWKKHYEPVEVGEKILIVPSWQEDRAREDKINVFIDPGMAFGTGLHETTRLAMHLLEEIDLEGKSLLDIGCGSGILSIFAELCGTDFVFACDIDKHAVEATAHNAKLNGVTRIRVVQSDLLSQVEGRFDVIAANLLAELHVDLIPQLGSVKKENTLLVLSGILTEKVDLVKDSLLANGWTLRDQKSEGEWTALLAG